MKTSKLQATASYRREIKDTIVKILQVTGWTQRRLCEEMGENPKKYEFRITRLINEGARPTDGEKEKLDKIWARVAAPDQAPKQPAPLVHATIQPGNIELPIFGFYPVDENKKVGDLQLPPEVSVKTKLQILGVIILVAKGGS